MVDGECILSHPKLGAGISRCVFRVKVVRRFWVEFSKRGRGFPNVVAKIVCVCVCVRGSWRFVVKL